MMNPMTIRITTNNVPETGRLTKSNAVFICPAPAVRRSNIIEPKTNPKTIGTSGQFKRLKINPIYPKMTAKIQSTKLLRIE
jgi:hypothetical protein